MSRTVIIDRFEGTFAICEGEGHGKEIKMYAIEIAELPQGAERRGCADYERQRRAKH